jgi:hypothetical protein
VGAAVDLLVEGVGEAMAGLLAWRVSAAPRGVRVRVGLGLGVRVRDRV